MTEAVYDALPESLQAYFTAAEDERLNVTVYEIDDISTEEMDQLLAENGIDWSREASLQRVKDDKLIYPLKHIDYSNAEVQIDIDALGITNNKRVLAASVFGDVSGFTRYIDRAIADDEGKTALRLLHAIRKEMSAIVRHDFSGIRVQFQGDRVQALFHMPKGDEKRIATRAVNTAIALQSAMESVIKKLFPEAKGLGMATGISIGTTLVSKLGTRGHRDRICIGDAVEEAARHQEGSAGGEIAVPHAVYELLEVELQNLFSWNKDRGLYIGTNLTQDKVERARKAALFKESVYVTTGAAGASVSSRPTPGSRSFVPSSSYGD